MSEQPRVPAGSPEGGQFASKGGVAYHGTISGKMGSIRQRGLQTKHAGRFYPGLSNTGAVYVSTDPETSAKYAIEAAVRYNMNGAYGTPDVKPVVYEVRIPKRDRGKVVPDDKDEVGKPGTGFKVQRNIPPSWIKKVARVANDPYSYQNTEIPALGKFERLRGRKK